MTTEAQQEANIRGRARHRGVLGSITPGFIGRLRETQGDRCGMCRRRFSDDLQSSLTVDHIVPLSRGGLHDDENIQLLCFSCNHSKSDRVSRDE